MIKGDKRIFCGTHFGGQQPAPTEPQGRRCVKCGTELGEGTLFCHICGFKQQ